MIHILLQALRQVIRCNGFPFEMRLDIPNEETMDTFSDHQITVSFDTDEVCGILQIL